MMKRGSGSDRNKDIKYTGLNYCLGVGIEGKVCGTSFRLLVDSLYFHSHDGNTKEADLFNRIMNLVLIK